MEHMEHNVSTSVESVIFRLLKIAAMSAFHLEPYLKFQFYPEIQKISKNEPADFKYNFVF